jgi:hypothetical protein
MVVSPAALAVAIGLAGPSFAQDVQTHMIGGVAVPEAEVEGVQTKCDELRAAVGSAASANTDADASTNSEANTTNSPAGDGDAATAADATTATESPAGSKTPAAGAPAADAAAADSTAADPTAQPIIDLATLTIEQCDEGGFTASPTP